MIIRPLVDPAVIVIVTVLLLGLVVAGATRSSRSERPGWWLRAVMVLLLAAIAFRPGLGRTEAPSRPSDLEVVFAVDRTTSMSALDWDGTQPRLAGAERDLTDLVKALPTSRFTVVTFGKSVRQEVPSTSDLTLIGQTVSLLRTEDPFAGIGSQVDRPLAPLRQLLEHLKTQHPDRRRLLVLMTDGENTSPGAQRSYSSLRPLLDAGLVLGYGTEQGARMPLHATRPGDGWVIDAGTGTPAVSHTDPANLHTIAEQLGVPYLTRTSPGGLGGLAKAWRARFTERTEGTATARVELTWLLAMALFVVALVDLRRHWRHFWQARQELA